MGEYPEWIYFDINKVGIKLRSLHNWSHNFTQLKTMCQERSNRIRGLDISFDLALLKYGAYIYILFTECQFYI